MPLRLKAKLIGLKEAAAAMDGLKKSVQRKILRQAVTAGARPILKAVKAEQKLRRTGQLSKSLDKKVKSYPRAVVAVIGPAKGFRIVVGKRPVDPVKYAHLVAGGVRPHAVGKGSSLRDRYKYTRASKAVWKKGRLVQPAVYERTLVRKASQRGRVHPGFEGTDFMRKGWDASRADAEAKVTERLAAGIAAEAARLAKAA